MSLVLSHAKSRKRRGRITPAHKKKSPEFNLRLCEEVDPGTYNPKRTELPGRLAELDLQASAGNRQQAEYHDHVLKTFELSRSLTEKWDNAVIPEKRELLAILGLSYRLDGVTLSPEINEAFRILAESPILVSGAEERI